MSRLENQQKNELRTVCYICRKEFKNNDVAIPVNIELILPFGRFHVLVMQHYMCGLDTYLDVDSLNDLTVEDKVKIEDKLMEVIVAINKNGIH